VRLRIASEDSNCYGKFKNKFKGDTQCQKKRDDFVAAENRENEPAGEMRPTTNLYLAWRDTYASGIEQITKLHAGGICLDRMHWKHAEFILGTFAGRS